MLAGARIGAIHSVVFGGFSANSIADRVRDCQSKLIITADEGLRGGKSVPPKANVDAALKMPGTNTVETVLVVRHTGGAVDMRSEEHTSELQSLMRNSYACFCLKKKK